MKSRPLHPNIVRAIQEIDAAVMNGDSFDDETHRKELIEYIERWARELAQDPGPEA